MVAKTLNSEASNAKPIMEVCNCINDGSAWSVRSGQAEAGQPNCSGPYYGSEEGHTPAGQMARAGRVGKIVMGTNR